jgi:type IV secretory pathway component VirB8
MAITMVFYGYTSYLAKNQEKANYDLDKDVILAGQNMLKKLLREKYNKNRAAALSHRFIGEMYEKEEKYAYAQAEYALAEQIFKNIYGSNKVATADIGEIYVKLAMLNAKVKEPVSAQEYLTKLQEVFGYKHPKTVKVTNYFLDNGMAIGF